MENHELHELHETINYCQRRLHEMDDEGDNTHEKQLVRLYREIISTNRQKLEALQR